MNRRTFLKGMLLTVAGLAVPPLALEEPARRLWALDGSMLADGAHIATAESLEAVSAFAESAGRIIEIIGEGLAGFDQLADFHAPDAEAVGDFSGFLFGGWDEDGTTPVLRHSDTGEELRFVADAFAQDMRVAAVGWYPARAPTITMTDPRSGIELSRSLRTIRGRYGL